MLGSLRRIALLLDCSFLKRDSGFSVCLVYFYQFNSGESGDFSLGLHHIQESHLRVRNHMVVCPTPKRQAGRLGLPAASLFILGWKCSPVPQLPLASPPSQGGKARYSGLWLCPAFRSLVMHTQWDLASQRCCCCCSPSPSCWASCTGQMLLGFRKDDGVWL